MPSYSTLNTYLGLALAIRQAQATVAVPYVRQSLTNITDELFSQYSRYPRLDDFRVLARNGVHFTIGTPGQHVWLLPNFGAQDARVNSIYGCDSPDTDINSSTWSGPERLTWCEVGRGGLYAQNESTSWDVTSTIGSSNGSVSTNLTGTDTFTIVEARPDFTVPEFEFTLTNLSNNVYPDIPIGYFGLSRGSSFFTSFFPGKEQVGLYLPEVIELGGDKLDQSEINTDTALYAGQDTLYGVEPSLLFEMEFDGFNESHFKGEKYVQGKATSKLQVNVTGLTVGPDKISLLDDVEGGSFMAELDYIGVALGYQIPGAAWYKWGNVTNGAGNDTFMHRYSNDSIPVDPKNWWNLTYTFSDGFSIVIPQDYFLKFADRERNGVVESSSWLVSTDAINDPSHHGAIITAPSLPIGAILRQLYIGIDYEKDEWWLAASDHQTLPKESGAWSAGSGLNKGAMFVACLATGLYMLL